MVVTIHYRLGVEKKYVPKILDKAEAAVVEMVALVKERAEKISIMGIREHPYRMRVEVGGCEWLQLGFGSMAHWQKKGVQNFNYELETLVRTFRSDDLENPEMMWCSAFCKTQHAENILEHGIVAEIIRVVAGFCSHVKIHDEGDYYYSDDLRDAQSAIAENGAMINGLGTALRQNFGVENVEQGGITKIQPPEKL